MASNWLYVDTNFPVFTDGQTPEEQMWQLQTYLFMLVEQLRYSLNNLDTDNMNEAGWKRFRTEFADTMLTQFNGTLADIRQSMTELQGKAKELETAQKELLKTTEGLAGMREDLDELERLEQELERKLEALAYFIELLRLDVQETENGAAVRLLHGEIPLSEAALPVYVKPEELDELRQAQAALEERVRALETDGGEDREIT